MSDIAEDVIDVLVKADGYDSTSDQRIHAWDAEIFATTAEAAIAAARPHIRAELFDELIAEAQSTFSGTYYDDVLEWFTIQDWLRSRKEGE